MRRAIVTLTLAVLAAGIAAPAAAQVPATPSRRPDVIYVPTPEDVARTRVASLARNIFFSAADASSGVASQDANFRVARERPMSIGSKCITAP